MRPEFGYGLKIHHRKHNGQFIWRKRSHTTQQLTPFSIIATLSARRAVESRCVMNMTVFDLSPLEVLEILVMVSNI